MAVEAAAVAPPMFVCVGGGGDLQPPVNSISGADLETWGQGGTE